MLKALTWKESRELMSLFSLALVGQLLFVLASMVPIAPLGRGNGIPFVSDPLPSALLFIGGLAAIALGFWQPAGELGRGTFLFLLHRPIDRTKVFTIKLAVGVALTLLIAGIPLFGYSIWAALPGTHASPFFWSMTTWAWLRWFRLPLFYLGAFLSGLRSARWLGSRAFPLAAALLCFMLLITLESWPLLALLATLAVEGCFLVAIYFVALARDYS
jgi:ABC-type transport system involved in multi-copper enzyme maturation permease subunit